jgi:coenzyme PQQ precursor peptide PqqA
LVVSSGAAYITGRERQMPFQAKEELMKIWNKPQVREQEVGLEVTSYLPAEIDII